MKRFLLATVAALAGLGPAAASAKLDVFACVPEWAALAQELGGDRVSIYAATNARQDPHRVEARPSLVARMRGADLMVCTGADLEVGWLPVLLQTAGNRKVQPGQPGHFMASDFVAKIEVPTSVDRSMGDVHPYGNPHVHLNPHNVGKIAKALAERLAAMDSANAAYYQARGQDFQARWNAAIARWEREAANLRGLKVVPKHKDSAYLFGWLGMIEVASIEPKPGIEPSAGHLAALLERLQTDRADLITRAAYQDPKAVGWLSERAKVPAVELPYTVGGSPEAKDLFGLFDDTIARLRKASGR